MEREREREAQGAAGQRPYVCVRKLPDDEAPATTLLLLLQAPSGYGVLHSDSTGNTIQSDCLKTRRDINAKELTGVGPWFPGVTEGVSHQLSGHRNYRLRGNCKIGG